MTLSVRADPLWFPPDLIADNVNIADISLLRPGQQLAGTYRVNIIVNGDRIDTRDVEFIATEPRKQAHAHQDDSGLMACLSAVDFIEFGVKASAFDSGGRKKENSCVDIASYIPQATTQFDFAAMQFIISIPQAWMENRPQGWISPERWEDGITAGLLNYTLSGTSQSGRYSHSQNYYLRLDSGLNWGPWRLRNERTLRESRGNAHTERKWDYGRTRILRGIESWLSELVIGDGTTSGDLFDATSFRGVQLRTDEGMKPYSQQGYAPVIRGTASSNAQVAVRQNGYVVYQTNVAPGPFEIKDLSPMFTSGELNVTVTEADGGVRTFTVPYASIPSLLRDGSTKYELMVGQLNDSWQKKHPTYVQGTLSWGLPKGVTAYGGLQYAERYQAIAAGSSLNLGTWGALSADITASESQLADGQQQRGQSLRFLYSRAFDALGTTVQLAGYRYSTEGFYTLEESYRARMSGWRREQQHDEVGKARMRPVSDWYDLTQKRRERMEVNLAQRIGEESSLYMTGSRQTFWGRRGTDTSLQAGFSSTIGGVTYSLSYNENRNSSLGRTDKGLFVGISMPLSNPWNERGSPIYLSSSLSQGSDGALSQQMGLSGNLLAQHNLNWNVSQGYSRQGGNTGNVYVGYQGGYGNASAGYGQGRDYRQLSYDVSGGLLIHSGGVTFGQPLGKTSVLVATSGAQGIMLESGSGVKTDWRGYAISPWASEYQDNRIALDVAQLDSDVDIGSPVKHVIPSKGAVVRADFQVKRGARVLMQLTHQGKTVPLGTMVSVENGSSSIVGDEGQVYLSGLATTGRLTAKWGNGVEQQCQAHWELNTAVIGASLLRLHADCQ